MSSWATLWRPRESAVGQTRKSGDAITTSTLPPTADTPESGCDVRKVPQPDFCLFTQLPYRHSGGAQEVRKAPAAWLS